ncbi:hypothetical protein [Polaribacter atrinae]|uniref:hypothetical protein n=1 Tax=Polaribacter atrinae TaxID=1333662 RepID=UPI002490B3B4|nr:hypothetical protein [Polaribacter atrinae]
MGNSFDYLTDRIHFYIFTEGYTKYEVEINKLYRDEVSHFNDFIILEYTKILHSTSKSLKLGRIDPENSETEFWIPKSVCYLYKEENLMAFPVWFLDGSKNYPSLLADVILLDWGFKSYD